jgi:hypothetical protein
MEQIKLSKNHTIYKTKYDGQYTIDDFLSLVKFNHENTVHTNNNSVWIEIESPIFDSINNKIKKHIEEITGKEFINYAKHNWVYTQRKNFDMEWMHQHIQVHPPGRSTILSDYTFTFYLQTTDEISGDEGKIIFQTEDGIKHKFLPQVGDIFIFDGDLRHTAMPTPNSEKERIVFAGSFCVDIFNQKNNKKYLV